jgi:hypothetical protein
MALAVVRARLAGQLPVPLVGFDTQLRSVGRPSPSTCVSVSLSLHLSLSLCACVAIARAACV